MLARLVGSVRRGEADDQRIGHVTKECRVERGSGFDLAAQRVKHADMDLVTQRRGENPGIELRLGHRTAHTEIPHRVPQGHNPCRAWAGRITQPHRPDSAHTERVFKILIGIVIDDKTLIPHGSEPRAQLPFEGHHLGLRGNSIFAECLGIFRVDCRQFLGNHPEPE